MLIGEENAAKYEHDGIGPPSLAQVEEPLFRVAQVASEVEFHELLPLPDRPRCHLVGNVGTSLPYKYCRTKMGKTHSPPEVIYKEKHDYSSGYSCDYPLPDQVSQRLPDRLPQRVAVALRASGDE